MTKINVTRVRTPLKVAFLNGLMTALLALVLFQQAAAQSGPNINAMERKIEFNIAARTPLEDALIEWGTTSGIAVMIDTHTVSDKTTAGVHGTLSAREALSLLLEGSGLSYKESGSRIMVIPIKQFNHVSLKRVDADVAKDIADVSSPLTTSSESRDDSYDMKNDRKLEQVVVTAQKRSEDILKVPVAMSVVSNERLAQLQVNALVDLDSFVPGLTIGSGGAPGLNQIVLRGLNANTGTSSGPSVATYIDELPVSGTEENERSAGEAIDLQPYDIAQVEVLKGPQGTLYGASTLAGLIKYRLVEPDLKRLDIVAGTSTEYIDGSAKPGWSVHGAVSLPIITDTLAVRLSGFKKNSAGYIDNVQLGLKDVNGLSESGGIGSVLWKPTEALTVKATVLAQDQNVANFAAVTLDQNTQKPVFGPNKEATHFLEPSWNHVRNYALTVNWDVGFATLTSATGYASFQDEQTYDLSGYGQYCDPANFPGNTGCPDYPHPDALAKWYNTDRTYKFTQETRLTSPANQRIQWMIGGFYSRERGGETEYIPAYTPSSQQLPSPQNDIVDTLLLSEVLTEAAGFGNVTFKISDRWDITAGERYSRYRISDSRGQYAGVLAGCGLADNGVCPVAAVLGGSTGVSVWMGNIGFHPSDDTLLYVRVSTGYQPGYFYTPVNNEPGVVLPSKTTNYEVGFKGRFLDDRLELDAAVFDIDWKDIQFSRLDDRNQLFNANGGSARSTGAELTSIYELIRGLRFTGTLAYTNARLNNDVPNGLGGFSAMNGDQLPQAPFWTGSMALDYQGALTQNLSWLSGVSYRYKDKVDGMFAGSGTPYEMGPQNIVNLYTGIGVQNLTAKLYVTNVTNDRSYSGFIFNGNLTAQYDRYVPIQPRTVGFGFEYRY